MSTSTSLLFLFPVLLVMVPPLLGWYPGEAMVVSAAGAGRRARLAVAILALVLCVLAAALV